nr:hypothetical protein [Tanacetum cinerariifolium]
MAQHTHRKKKSTLIVIPSIRFTKLIIYHLQRKHKFHSRPDSPLHLPNEELVLGYLKFSAKGTKREVTGMPIPGNLITTDIQEISDQPSLARKSNPGLVSKRRKPISSLRSVDESVAKGIPEKEPSVDNEEAGVHRALEESLKSAGKGKEKVTDEQVARDLLTLQMPKKNSPADQYIFQRHTSTPTGSSGHDESSSLYVELGLIDSKVESDEDVLGIDAGVQDTSSIPPMTTPVIDLTSRPESPNVHQPLQATATETTTTTTIHPPPSQPQQSTTNSMLMKRISELEHIMANLIKRTSIWRRALLRNHFRDLPEADMKEILHQRMWETNSYKTYEDHMILYEALEKSMNRDHSPYQLPPPSPPAGPSGASGSSGAFGSSQVLPPPPAPPSNNQEGQSQGSAAPSSSKTVASIEYQAWTMTDTRLRQSVSLTPADLQMDDDMAPDAQA